MTLQRYDGVAVSIARPARTVVHPPARRRQTGSRFCPACLGDSGGRWQLAWRLPWAFACPVHRRLLADLCPACGRRPAAHRLGLGAPSMASTCTVAVTSPRRRWRTPACAQPLVEVCMPTVTEPVLAAQRHVWGLIDMAIDHQETGQDGAATTSLRDVHVIAQKALAALHIDAARAPATIRPVIDACGGQIPQPRARLDSFDAHAVAVGTTLAVDIQTGHDAGGRLLAWIVHSDQLLSRPAEPRNLLLPWRGATPGPIGQVLSILDSDFTTHSRLSYGTAGLRPRAPDASDKQVRRRAASLPALLWPLWSMRLVPAAKASTNGVDATQAALAALTLLPRTRLTYSAAADLLGGYATRHSIRAMVDHLDPDVLNATIRMVTALADQLDGQPAPINYQRRRALFSGAMVNRGSYALFAARQGWPPPNQLQLRLLDHHLSTMLLGTPGARLAGAATRGSTGGWNPLLRTLPAALRPFITGQAHAVLRSHHIREPLVWHPDPFASPGGGWPGVVPDAVNQHQFAQAITAYATARCQLVRIGEVVRLSGIHIRLLAQIVELDMPIDRWIELAAGPDVTPATRPDCATSTARTNSPCMTSPALR
jgi:hypothetical protein